LVVGGVPLKYRDSVAGAVDVAGFASGMAGDEVAQQGAHVFNELLKK
jgi:uncharacterized protein GlcG (DUF336 family)